MKYCPACNAMTLDNEAIYCIECGSPLSDRPAVKSSNPSNRVPALDNADTSSSVRVDKGHKVDLSKNQTVFERVRVDINWQSDAGFDIDAAAFLLNETGKVSDETDFVFYNNPNHRSGAVKHLRLNNQLERITIELKKLPSAVSKIDFTLTINDAEIRRQNFGRVHGIVLSVIDDVTNKELIHYALGDDFSVETAIVIGEIYQYKGKWKFHAVGAGFSGGLAALCNNFGIEIEGGS